MSSRVILSADSTCDLGDELRARYDVQYYPFHVILDGRQYGDGVDLTPDRIYEVYRERKILPKPLRLTPPSILNISASGPARDTRSSI